MSLSYSHLTYPSSAWHDRGGLIGRGVLLDYKAYADKNGIHYDPTDRHVITIQELEKVAVDEGVNFQEGDVLIIRSGLTALLQAADDKKQASLMGKGTFAGVEDTVDAAKWCWDHHFAAVAGDMLAFEVYPPSQGTELGQCHPIKC